MLLLNTLKMHRLSNYKEYINSVLWSSGLLYLFFILNFIGQITLARMLLPEHFGIIVLSLSIIEILKIFFGFSISMAYIRMDNSDTLIGTANFLAVCGWIGMLLFSLLFYYPFSIFFSTKVSLFVVIISFFSIFTYISYIIESDLEKNNNFKKSSFIVGISSFLAMCIAILFAYFGFEEKSLLFREIAGPIILFIISFKYFNKKISFSYDKKELKEMFLFVFKMLFSRGSEIIYLKAPLIIISNISGTTTLGLISQMLYLAQLPAVALGPIANKVSYVFYSNNKNNENLQNNGRNIISILLLIMTLPFFIICYFYSYELLNILWGEKWVNGANYLQQLSAFILIYPIFMNFRTFLYSKLKNELVTITYIIASIMIFFLMYFTSEKYLGYIFSITMFLMIVLQIYFIRKYK